LSRLSSKQKDSAAWLLPVCAALALVFLLGLYSGESFDPDFWAHLKTGEYTVQHRHIAVPDPFSYTTADAKPAYPGEAQTRYFNLTHEWLAQSAIYLVYAAGGFPAIVLVRALWLTAAGFLTGAIAAKRTGSWWWGVAAVLATGSVGWIFATDRPTLVSPLFTMLFLAAFEWRRYLWALPVIALVWANCHGGFFLGWLVCGAYLVDALLQRRADVRPTAIATAAVVLASGLNPNGFGIVTTLLRYQQSAITANNLEWRQAELWGEPHGYNILLYLCVPVLLLAWRRVRPADWLLFVFFAATSLKAFRNEIYIGLYAPILIASYFPIRLRLPQVVRYAGAAALLAAIGFGIVEGPFFQLRAAEWRYPVRAEQFLRENHIQGRIFPTMFIAGYMVWKGHQDFFDGRSLSENVFRDYQTVVYATPGDPARSEVLERYGIQAIVMDAFEYYTGTIYPLVQALAADPKMSQWKLVFADPSAMVFLRNPPDSIPDLGRAKISDQVEEQCRMLIARDPKYPGCARSLGFIFRGRNPARARRMFELYFANGGADEDARQAMAALGP